MEPVRRVADLFGIDLPILQAPMAGASGPELAIAVASAGGLGSLPSAMLTLDQVRAETKTFRRLAGRPLNLNFFCHTPPTPDLQREAAWRRRLAPYYAELGIDPATVAQDPGRMPFDEAACDMVEDVRPEIVSFHFGLPDERLLDRVRSAGALVVSSATTVKEAKWLDARGCDAIIAQGAEAGGHRGTFLDTGVPTQVGTFALVPQVVDAVGAPVIAAGGIADARGIVAALALGAAAVQIGTAYLRCPESLVRPLHRAALAAAGDGETVLTNVFTGKPARGFVNRFVREVGPMTDKAPAFPLATSIAAPLRARAEAAGSPDFTPLWAGQAAALAPALPAAELTRKLADEAAEFLGRFGGAWPGQAAARD